MNIFLKESTIILYHKTDFWRIVRQGGPKLQVLLKIETVTRSRRNQCLTILKIYAKKIKPCYKESLKLDHNFYGCVTIMKPLLREEYGEATRLG